MKNLIPSLSALLTLTSMAVIQNEARAQSAGHERNMERVMERAERQCVNERRREQGVKENPAASMKECRSQRDRAETRDTETGNNREKVRYARDYNKAENWSKAADRGPKD